MSPLLSFFFEVRSPTITRVAIAASIAPPLAMIVYGLLMPMILKAGPEGVGPITLNKLFGMASMTFLYGSIIAYLGMLIVGLPTFLVLRCVRAELGFAYLLVGATSLPLLITFGNGELPPHFSAVLLAAAPGFLVAGFWSLFASR